MSISGLVLHVLPEKSQSVQIELERMDGVEIHMATGDGRLIVTVDAADDQKAADTFTALQHLDGVLSTSLAYSHFGEDAEIETPREDAL